MNKFVVLSRLDGDGFHLCLFNLAHIERIESRGEYSTIVMRGRDYDINVKEPIHKILQKINEAD